MGQLETNSAVGTYAADYLYQTKAMKPDNAVKTDKTYGRTIGNPELSEKAQKYYEKLKAKYSNMDFILVSPEQKKEAEKNKGMYASQKELLVLIDSDKIEKMAEDASYRAKYEGILSGATAQMNQMKQELGGSADCVKSFGMTFDDGGNASFFAVVDKSLAKQSERIEKKRAEAKEAKKEAAEKAKEKRAEEKAAEKNENQKGDYVTVSSSSWEQLLHKVNAILYNSRADSMMTEEEKKVGGGFDFSI